VFRGGERLGLFYSDTGFSQRSSQVIYDRKNSAFSELKISRQQWEEILEGKSWFHFCGTAPTQGATVVDSLITGLQVAKEKGLTVSVDYNYRSKLWDHATAQKVMEPLMEYVDVGIGNEEDWEAVFGIKADGSDFAGGIVDSRSYEAVAKKMVEKYNLKYQAITLRESTSANINNWSAIIHDGEHCYESQKYTVHIIDRIGGGDSFSGGLIYCLSEKKTLQEAINFSVAASCLKQTLPGDFNLVRKEEVLSLMQGNSSGRVQR